MTIEYKKNEYVEITNKEIVNTSNIINVDGVDYMLIGVICHQGEKGKSGHYVYYEYDNNGNIIRLYNDSSVINSDNSNSTEYNDDVDHNGTFFLYSRYPVDQYNTNKNLQ